MTLNKQEFKKILVNCFLSLATLVLSCLFWNQEILLIILLAIVGLLMLVNDGSKIAVLFYFVGFVLGPLAESFAIYSGAWVYSNPYILGFPIWLPFVWGNAALFFRRATSFLNSFNKS